MNLLKFINIYAFIISLAFGIFAVYIFNSDRTIYVYPTPENVNELLYRDKTNNCFKFQVKEVTCPSEGEEGLDNIASLPPQY